MRYENVYDYFSWFGIIISNGVLVQFELGVLLGSGDAGVLSVDVVFFLPLFFLFYGFIYDVRLIFDRQTPSHMYLA